MTYLFVCIIILSILAGMGYVVMTANGETWTRRYHFGEILRDVGTAGLVIGYVGLFISGLVR